MFAAVAAALAVKAALAHKNRSALSAGAEGALCASSEEQRGVAEGEEPVAHLHGRLVHVQGVSRPMKAETSMSSVDSGRWKFVMSASTAL